MVRLLTYFEEKAQQNLVINWICKVKVKGGMKDD